MNGRGGRRTMRRLVFELFFRFGEIGFQPLQVVAPAVGHGSEVEQGSVLRRWRIEARRGEEAGKGKGKKEKETHLIPSLKLAYSLSAFPLISSLLFAPSSNALIFSF
jgi:hypothetical protein